MAEKQLEAISFLRRNVLFQAAALLVLPAAAMAGSLDQDFFGSIGCLKVRDEHDRLDCFDREVGALSADVAQQRKIADAETFNWNGNGTCSLPPFNVKGPWTLAWTCDDHISIEILRSNTTDELAALIDSVSSDATDHGSSYERAVGALLLSVTSYSGNWTVSVSPA